MFTSHLDEAYFLTEYKRYTHIICIFQAVALSFSNVPQSIGAVLLVQDYLLIHLDVEHKFRKESDEIVSMYQSNEVQTCILYIFK